MKASKKKTTNKQNTYHLVHQYCQPNVMEAMDVQAIVRLVLLAIVRVMSHVSIPIFVVRHVLVHCVTHSMLAMVFVDEHWSVVAAVRLQMDLPMDDALNVVAYYHGADVDLDELANLMPLVMKPLMDDGCLH